MTTTTDDTTTAAGTHDARPVSYPPDAVLTYQQVAEWLDVSVRTVQDKPIRVSRALGERNPRILARWVYEYLEAHAA